MRSSSLGKCIGNTRLFIETYCLKIRGAFSGSLCYCRFRNRRESVNILQIRERTVKLFADRENLQYMPGGENALEIPSRRML